MRTLLFVAAAALVTATTSLCAAPVGSAFSYQGSLREAGAPANGTYDFEVCLFPIASGGSAIGCNPIFDDQPVVDGLFTLTLDFGTAPFRGEARWLELRVRPGAGGSFTPLAPRTALQPVPYALHALSVDAAAGVPAPTIRLIGPYFLASLNNSLAVGSSGLPVLTVTDFPGGAPRLSFWLCDDAPCTSGRLAPFYTGTAGDLVHAAVAVGNDGLAVAAFVANNVVRLARCNDAACASPAVSLDLLTNQLNQGLDVAVTSANTAVVSTKDLAGTVRTIACDTPACGGVTINVVFATGDTSGSVALSQTGIALAAGDLPRVAYASQANGNDIQLASCADPTCTGAIARRSLAALQSFDGAVSLALANDGVAAVAHSRAEIPAFAEPSTLLLQCADAACTGAVTTRQFFAPNANAADPQAGSSVLVIGQDSVPLVAFGGSDTGGMHLLHGRPREFTVDAAAVSVLDAQSAPHPTAAIALRPNGLPVVAYRGPDGLRLASCSTRTCQ